MRIHQYLKNLFIFLPIFFGHKIQNQLLLINTLIAFISFSFISSAIYIFNDIRDIESDRTHPVKKMRPLAAGKISLSTSIIVMICSFIIGMSTAYYLGRNVMLLLLLYIAINIAYTLILKKYSIMDIAIISSGFIIRLFVGAETSQTQLSMWIILMTFLLTFFLGLGKRRDEIVVNDIDRINTRKSINGYNKQFIDSAMMIMSSVIIITYIMYTISSDVILRAGTDKLYITAIWVVLGIMRYLQISIVEKNSGSPTVILMKDRILQLILIGWISTFLVISYF
jgi:4-hydroxybenzoate polyprenyltransferase